MKVPYFSVYKLHQRIHNELIKSIESCLESGVFSGGEQVEKFEIEFSEYTGSKHFIGCSNGTDAIEIILRSLSIGKGDEVIVPEFSCQATAEPLYLVGAKPVFAPVKLNDYCLDPSRIKPLISEKTKAVIAVHLFGNAAEAGKLADVCRSHELHLIEDCAQAHGLRIHEKHVGNFGIAGTFSFYPTKNLGALGEAGGILTNDDELAVKCRKWIDHGQKEKNVHEFPGRNARMDTLQAAVLSLKLKYLDIWNDERAHIAEIYKHQLPKELIITRPFKTVNHIFPVRIDDRDVLREYLWNKGIKTSVHYPYLLSSMKPEGFTRELVSLPIYPGLTEDLQELVIDSLNSYF